VPVCVPVDSEPVSRDGEDAKLLRGRMYPTYHNVPHTLPVEA
jgi:hypothetical protein